MGAFQRLRADTAILFWKDGKVSYFAGLKKDGKWTTINALTHELNPLGTSITGEPTIISKDYRFLEAIPIRQAVSAVKRWQKVLEVEAAVLEEKASKPKKR